MVTEMITEEYIIKVLKEYASTKAGQKKIYEATGITYIPSNLKPKLTHYGNEMKSILYNHIFPLIRSISRGDIIVGEPYQVSKEQWCIDISFAENSLERSSLYPEKYPNGVANIILLFSKGYTASNSVRGKWVTKYGNHGYVRSKEHRDGNDFLNNAVDEFNAKYGKEIGKAILREKYK